MPEDDARRSRKGPAVLIAALVLLVAGTAGATAAGIGIAHHLHHDKTHCGPLQPGERWNCPGPGVHPLSRSAARSAGVGLR